MAFVDNRYKTEIDVELLGDFRLLLEGPQGTKSLAVRLAASAFILRTLIAAWLGAFLAFNTRLDFGGHFECGDGHVVGQCL